MPGYFPNHGLYLSQILHFLKDRQKRNKTHSRLISPRSPTHDCQMTWLVGWDILFGYKSAQ